MHHLAVALDEELVGDLDGADLGHAADVVAAEIEQHEMLGALLRIGEQLRLQRFVFVRGCAAPPRARDRADGHDAVAGFDQDFRARSGDRERAEVEEEQIGRRVHPAQRAIKRERRQRERRLEALRQHHLKNIAGGNVLLGAQHHVLELGVRGVRPGRHFARASFDLFLVRRGEEGRGFVERTVERVDDLGQPRRAPAIMPASRTRLLRPYGRDDGDRVLDRVEDDHHGRTNQDRIRNADRIGARRRQAVLDQPNHVVAEIPEHAGGHRRQPVRQRDAAFLDESAQGRKRRLRGRRKALRVGLRIAIDLGVAAVGAEDEIRLKADDRVAAANRAAFDGLEQKAYRWRVGRGCAFRTRPSHLQKPVTFRKAETGVSRSATSVVHTTCGEPAA